MYLLVQSINHLLWDPVALFKSTDRDLRGSEELFQHDVHAPEDLREQEVVASLVYRRFSLVKSLRSR